MDQSGLHRHLYWNPPRLYYPEADVDPAGTTIPVAPPLSQFLDSASSTDPQVDASLFEHENLEINTFIQRQNQVLRMGLAEASKRHARALLLAARERAVKKLAEKDAEAESARLRRAELEEAILRAREESQRWFDLAKEHDDTKRRLEADLEKARRLEESAGSCAALADEPDLRLCQACEMREVNVLVLPCRHLSVCSDCAAKIAMCPTCGHPRYAHIAVNDLNGGEAFAIRFPFPTGGRLPAVLDRVNMVSFCIDPVSFFPNSGD